jgi:hypothetical protein
LKTARETLGAKLGRRDKSITQSELDILVEKNTSWSRNIESGRTKEIQPGDRMKIDSLAKNSPAKLQELLKDFSTNQLGEKQKENRSYMQDIRKKLGEKLGRRSKSISQFELDFLVEKNFRWSNKIESGHTKEIQPEDRIKLDSLVKILQQNFKNF